MKELVKKIRVVQFGESEFANFVSWFAKLRENSFMRIKKGGERKKQRIGVVNTSPHLFFRVVAAGDKYTIVPTFFLSVAKQVRNSTFFSSVHLSV